MESNINYKGISEYAKKYAERIYDRFFMDKGRINGQEILQLSEINQINLFILMDIFQKWKEEVKKIRSPYFNYDAPEVGEAMDNLMNILSRNIEITGSDFKPLLARAVQQGILIIFSPYDFFRNEFFTRTRTVGELKEATKFIRINSFLLNAVVEQAEKNNMNAVDEETALEILNKLMENTHETPEEFEPYIKLFSETVPLELDQIYSEQEAGMISNQSSTINDHFSHGVRPMLAELQKKVRIDNIRNHITINQRFMFVNDLFKGNVDEFTFAVEELEKQPTYDNALIFLKSSFAEKNDWDMESETVVEFLDVVEKRYH